MPIWTWRNYMTFISQESFLGWTKWCQHSLGLISSEIHFVLKWIKVMLEKIIWTHSSPSGPFVSEISRTLFNTVSIFASPSANFGVFSRRLFIPTCSYWLTSQHTTGRRTYASSGQDVAMDTASSKPVNENFFYPLFLEGEDVKICFLR